MTKNLFAAVLVAAFVLPTLAHSASFQKRAHSYNEIIGSLMAMPDFPGEPQTQIVPLTDDVDQQLKGLKWADCFIVEGSTMNDVLLARSVKRCAE